jgi:hypothetical protein
MPSKSHVTVGCFFVTSLCKKAGSEAQKIALGSQDVDHVLEFHNGSTLPYDVRAQTTHPDQVIDFSYSGGARQADWQASKIRIGPNFIAEDKADIHCVTSSKTKARIQTPTITIEYRLANTVPRQPDPRVATRVLEIDPPIE